MLLRLFLLLSLLTSACVAQALDQDLELEQLAPGVMLHRSWMEIEGFGRVESNGLIYSDNGECVVIDTPGTPELCERLLEWTERQGFTTKALIVGHTHQDSMGGSEVFQARGIPVFSSRATQSLALEEGKPLPDVGYESSIKLRVGDSFVLCYYPGPGHTLDNAVVYLPKEKILFGGCLLKALGAGKGNLADARVSLWPTTVRNVAEKFSDLEIVVPGHGKIGDRQLLEYTIEMFEKDTP